MNEGVVAFVTYPQNTENDVQDFIQGILEARLAACINMMPVNSRYWWQGNLEADQEFLLVIKTTHDKIQKLEEWILKHHPYQVPEFVVLPTVYITQKYAQWLTHETHISE